MLKYPVFSLAGHKLDEPNELSSIYEVGDSDLLPLWPEESFVFDSRYEKRIVIPKTVNGK